MRLKGKLEDLSSFRTFLDREGIMMKEREIDRGNCLIRDETYIGSDFPGGQVGSQGWEMPPFAPRP